MLDCQRLNFHLFPLVPSRQATAFRVSQRFFDLMGIDDIWLLPAHIWENHPCLALGQNETCDLEDCRLMEASA
jgi:hypothetical protein